MSTAAGVPHLLRTELLVHWRHGLLPATGGLVAMWALVLLALPAGWRGEAVPWVLFLELAALGFFFVPALAVVERGNGVTAALRLTRLSPARAVGVRVGTLAAVALATALVLLPVAGLGWSPTVLVGAVLTSALLSLVALVMVGRAETLTSYMSRVPPVAIPLLVPALLRGTGLWDAPVLALSPATGALGLLGGHWSWGAAAWLTAWIAGLWVAATRLVLDARLGSGSLPSRRGAELGPLPGSGWRVAVRSLARVDRRTLLGDRLLLLVLAGVPLMALAARWVGGAGATWLAQRHGIDVAGHLPAVWALVLVLHTPTMLGSVAGLLFLEDRDAGLLPAIATTPSSLRTLLAYRLGGTALVTAAAVAVGLVIAGAEHAGGAAGVLATAAVAGGVALVPAALMATLVRDRVQGMALMKLIALPLYLPLAWWYVEGPAGWLFVLVPTGWAVRALWSSSAAGALGFALAGVAASLLLATLVLRRLGRSLVG